MGSKKGIVWRKVDLIMALKFMLKLNNSSVTPQIITNAVGKI